MGRKKAEENGKPRFFGLDHDRRGPGGAVSSEYPAWYYERRLKIMDDNIKERVSKLEHDRRQGFIAPDVLAREQEDISRQVERRDAIKASFPIFSGSEKDEIAKCRKVIGEQIRDLKFDRTSMMRGTADPHAELERSNSFNVDVRECADLARDANCPVDERGFTTRKHAERLWRICSRSLGESADSEQELVRDHKHGTYELANRLARMIDGSADYSKK